MIAFIIFAQGLVLYVHYILYRFGIEKFEVLANNRYLFGSIILFLSFSFFISMVLSRYLYGSFTDVFFKYASIWLGALVWIFISIVFCVLFQFLIPQDFVLYKILPSIFILLALFINIYGIYHASSVVIIEKDLYIENLPTNWIGKRVVFLADTHYGKIHNAAKANKDVALLESLKPDAIMIAGDFFDGPHHDLSSLSSPYKKLSPLYGKYVAEGNHDSYAGRENAYEALRNSGFTILDDNSVEKDGLLFSGVSYTTNNESTIDVLNTRNMFEDSSYDKTKPNLVIKHVPIATNEFIDHGSSFVFFGHTHRGQIWPFSIFTHMLYGEYAYGFVEKGNTTFYTTSGLGSWGPIQRIGTDSELLVVTLKNKK